MWKLITKPNCQRYRATGSRPLWPSHCLCLFRGSRTPGSVGVQRDHIFFLRVEP